MFCFCLLSDVLPIDGIQHLIHFAFAEAQTDAAAEIGLVQISIEVGLLGTLQHGKDGSVGACVAALGKGVQIICDAADLIAGKERAEGRVIHIAGDLPFRGEHRIPADGKAALIEIIELVKAQGRFPEKVTVAALFGNEFGDLRIGQILGAAVIAVEICTVLGVEPFVGGLEGLSAVKTGAVAAEAEASSSWVAIRSSITSSSPIKITV